MNKQALFASWFRQQSELLMPDLIIEPAAAALLSRQGSAEAAASGEDRSGEPAGESKEPVRQQAADGLKNRLSALRPADQLVLKAQESRDDRVSDKRSALREIYRAGCTKCHLAESRTSFVFGGGNAEAPVMVIGEAPGRDEDEQGLPFVGAAGKLLTGMLAAIRLDRNKDVFITNILKCRPPGNRNPESAEIVTCIPMLQRQIEIIAPKAILLLGRIAAHALLDISDSIAKMRQKVFDYQGIPAMVIYHPAALLRNPEYKRPAWEDLQQFEKLLAASGVYGSLHEK